MKQKILFACTVLLALGACKDRSSDDTSDSSAAAIPAPVMMNYSIVKVYPHDTASYTQGLIWYNNTFYEGTGLYGESKLLQVDLNNGKSSKRIDLSKDYFGEGITIFNNKIYQLTWQEHKVFVYDLATFKKTGEFNWPYEGWGLTHDGKQLLVSTGGNNIYYVNPETFAIEKTLGVSDNNGYVSNINELEYVNGMIYANQYETNYILKINAATGLVEGRMDLSGILEKTNQPFYSNRDYMNGIAYDAAKNSFYVTGKKWPALYEIKLN
jgi:glutamine cyclotransferase